MTKHSPQKKGRTLKCTVKETKTNNQIEGKTFRGTDYWIYSQRALDVIGTFVPEPQVWYMVRSRNYLCVKSLRIPDSLRRQNVFFISIIETTVIFSIKVSEITNSNQNLHCSSKLKYAYNFKMLRNIQSKYQSSNLSQYEFAFKSTAKCKMK